MTIRASEGNGVISSWWKQCVAEERRHPQRMGPDVQSVSPAGQKWWSEPAAPFPRPCLLKPSTGLDSQGAFLIEVLPPSSACPAVCPRGGTPAFSGTLSSLDPPEGRDPVCVLSTASLLLPGSSLPEPDNENIVKCSEGESTRLS